MPFMRMVWATRAAPPTRMTPEGEGPATSATCVSSFWSCHKSASGTLRFRSAARRRSSRPRRRARKELRLFCCFCPASPVDSLLCCADLEEALSFLDGKPKSTRSALDALSGSTKDCSLASKMSGSGSESSAGTGAVNRLGFCVGLVTTTGIAAVITVPLAAAACTCCWPGAFKFGSIVCLAFDKAGAGAAAAVYLLAAAAATSLLLDKMLRRPASRTSPRPRPSQSKPWRLSLMDPSGS
mmetsp:Transcript_8030/g.17937  ORF Transcript_8030/g.17937 Transcript_8030/m.17937 type:complete len:240 (-) Transcript_8030:2644-3363(-)